jgi:hypothetical protein
MSGVTLPVYRQPLTAGGDLISQPWYRWATAIQGQIGAAGNVQAQIQNLQNEINALSGFNIRAPESVAMAGTTQQGIVVLTLVNDEATPGNTYFYGTNTSGAKGWNAVSSALAGSSTIGLTTAGTGITTFALEPVTLTSGGTLQATAFDAYGRAESTQAITWATAGSVALAYNSAANTVTAALNTTGVTAGTYGDGTHVPTLTVDVNGRITGASDTAINFPAAPVTSVFGRTGAVVATAGDYTFAQIGSTPTTLSGYGITNGVTNTTQVIAGTGLSGGGALSGNVTLSLASQAAATLLGVPAGAGAVPTAITLGTNLSMTSGGVLNATGGGGSGTVTSVGLSMPTQFSISGTNPITGSGTFTVTWASAAANTFLAAPNGSAGAPAMRAIALPDLPAGYNYPDLATTWMYQ